MPQSIKCKVTECQYNRNVTCDAPMIEVDRNNTSSAKNSGETQCQTFRPSMS